MSSVDVKSVIKPGKHLPGEAGIWLFILGDMVIFALFFLTFVFYRAQNTALYMQFQPALNQTYGLLNTLLLLSSSWLVALATRGARKGWGKSVPRLFGGAFLCGVGFGVIKFLEYGEKIHAGITVMTNEFFMFYFMFTGIHFLHLLIGLGVLVYLIKVSRKPNHSAADIMILESGAVFWHLVDLLWIVLFALLYLMR